MSDYTCTLSAELIQKAKSELNEDPALRDRDIEALREWILKQKHIHGRTDDRFLLIFLRNAKFSLEAAKHKIDNYYTIRSMIPEWFFKQDPMNPQTQELIKLGRIVSLGYDDEGRRITLIRLGAESAGIHDCNKFTIDDMLRMDLLYTRVILNDEQTQICGAVTIFDFDQTTTRSMMLYTPVNLKKIAASYQDCMPIRLRKFVIWNSTTVFDVIYSVLKVFAKPKLLKRLWKAGAGSNIDVLHSEISPKYLPTEYGGTAGDLQYFIDKTRIELMSFREECLEERNYFMDESNRPGKPRTREDILGIDGSFRKLTID